MLRFTQNRLIALSALLFTLFYNFKFFKDLFAAYGFSASNLLYFFSIGVVLTFLIIFLLTLFSSKYTTKPILITLFVVSAFTSYFMDSYSVVIDSEMIRNSLQTSFKESVDLFSFRLVLYVVFLAIIPSYIVYKTKINYKSLKGEIVSKLKTITLSLVIIFIIIFSFSKFYTSFFREHKPLRYNINPIYWIYSIGNYVHKTLDTAPTVLKDIGLDAKVVENNSETKELIILVVGETARADRFSLNGYSKETNPLLKQENIVSFTNMYSCGTSTAHSVPCMFSIFPKDEYTYKKGASTKNVLDVLNNTQDVAILWRDNNSDSKGVALRVDYEDFKTPKTNSICDEECRDEGMLVGLEDYIEKNKNKNILIVLHQMGNHGPAYYKRYPKEFEKFTPVCKTNQLENCTKEEISNAYDNAILYTDYFLSKAINFLKKYSNTHEAGLLYVSDHGESLGENGIYLHGMPYAIAPKAQTHVASLIWLDNGQMAHEYDINKIKQNKDKEYSHDNLFDTLLGLFEVKTEVYKKELDILNEARKED
ncbi:phosphoethanolamine transferase [Aliarcobacter cryaerophilus]|uniref:phosphoethanolamine transferase n=1 Tax=Aliarcobacter cryaerophilus TaxID=28198 RepID=UPI0021B43C96|nr:phosphoethanolamine--lipid A transferase [Aliarcobacter cryaerophilus]MCT7499732.1 phosphoethanolamine--lipid A transferase [Aliarcobacter cryaerophilus]MCT7543538.1 phosphoethanolamine--lipid A transferase [Aliarcobacter cryaerophilus]